MVENELIVLSFLKLQEEYVKNPTMSNYQAIDIIMRVIGEDRITATKEEREKAKKFLKNR